MGVSSSLQAVMTDSFGNDNGTWRQFVCDHLDYIQARSPTYLPEPEVMNQYKYDLSDYLKVGLSRKKNIGWIVCLLNGMASDLEFDESRTYVIPTDELISQLYTTYKSVLANPQ